VRTVLIIALAATAAIGSAGCAPRVEGEGLSLLGRTLRPLEAGKNSGAERNLAEAKAAADAAPGDLEKQIWLGRRYGYLWRMRDAIAVFTQAAKDHPTDPRPLRHRGHRYISVREFSKAVADLDRGVRLLANTPDQIEPDGVPNLRNFPLTTTGFNIHYHLALAHYLLADYEAALAGWRSTARFERGQADNRVAVAYWTYLTLRKLNRESEAKAEIATVLSGMDIIENHAYHRLGLYFKGELTREQTLRPGDEDSPDFAALGYGIGTRDMLDGKPDDARALFERVIATDNWPAFGYIAAEVELARERN
jgi:tetratricopeptide (TPR) repeat protein